MSSLLSVLEPESYSQHESTSSERIPEVVEEQCRPRSSLRIAIFIALLNAGGTTRGIELAKGIQDLAKRRGIPVDLRFFAAFYSRSEPNGDDDKCNGTRQSGYSYESQVHEAGFVVEHIGPGFTPNEWAEILKREHSGRASLFTRDEKERAVEMLRLAIQGLERYRPTIVLHGINPEGPLAAKILGIPNIAFVPLPFSQEWIRSHMLARNQNFFMAVVPQWLWKALNRYYCKICPSTLTQAAVECGWKIPKGSSGSFLDMISAQETLVTDLPGNYPDAGQLPNHTYVTGPLFAQKNDTPVISPEICQVFAPDNSNKIFLSMGSSGETKYLLEAIQALCIRSNGDQGVHAVVVVPPNIRSLQQVRDSLDIDIPSNVYLTDAFLPAKAVNGMADAAIVHGGQGTVQTAMAVGTPIVGIGFQTEQQFNLGCIVKRGAGIRIEKEDFRAPTIAKAVRHVLEDPCYKESARAVQEEMEKIDGRAVAAERILAFAVRAAKKSSS